MQSQVGDNYDPNLLRQDFQWIASFYQMHGYQFARVDEEQLVALKFSDGVYLRIYIDEGRIGRITINGNTRTKTDVIRQELLLNAAMSTYRTMSWKVNVSYVESRIWEARKFLQRGTQKPILF